MRRMQCLRRGGMHMLACSIRDVPRDITWEERPDRVQAPRNLRDF